MLLTKISPSYFGELLVYGIDQGRLDIIEDLVGRYRTQLDYPPLQLTQCLKDPNSDGLPAFENYRQSPYVVQAASAGRM